jgi:5,5'-dehydrodivanillate O-demethylase
MPLHRVKVKESTMLSVKENERLTRVGPGTPMGALLRRYWHPVAASAALAENPVKLIKILGESLVLFRDRQGRLGLIGDTCPHRRISLLYGIPEEEGLRCPYHGWMFDCTGQCIEMPAEAPESTFKNRVQIPGYPVEELGGLIFAYLGPQPAPLLPRWDLFVMDGVWRDIGVTTIPCNWLQCMENSLDPVHTEWLHGHYYNYVMERKKAQDERGQGFVARLLPSHVKIGFDVFEHGIIKRRVRTGGSEEDAEWRVGHPILFPNILRVGWTFQIRVPMDDTHTWHVMYQVYPQPPGANGEKQENIPVYEIPLTDEHGQHITDFVLGQDMMAWVTQGPTAERQLERLGESDKGIILYRRLLREQITIAEEGKDPMNVFRDSAKNQILHIPTEHDLIESARARRLSTGQAPYSPLLDQIETQWANAPSAAD